MKILIFTEGTILMHKKALGKSRDEAVRQVKEKEASVKDYGSYIPIGDCIKKLNTWKKQGADIIYLTSRTTIEDIEKITALIKQLNFPNHQNILHRKNNEKYSDLVEGLMPNILIEDDCKSLEGPASMVSPALKLSKRKSIHSIVVQEFMGIDNLPDDIAKLARLRTINIDPFSSIPVSLDIYLENQRMGGGTGFIVRRSDVLYLITNWHVVTGRHIETREPISKIHGNVDPNIIHIWRRRRDNNGATWIAQIEKLRDEKFKPLWYEHPTLSNVDVIALPIRDDEPFRDPAFELDLNLSEADIEIYPSEPVSIVGFPHGRSVCALWPIWKTGHVASDIDIDYDDGKKSMPVFLIDATTKPGMSGSPVIAKRVGPYCSKWFGVVMNFGQVNRFMGIYSGRIEEEPKTESNIGMVWKPRVIEEVIDGAKISSKYSPSECT